MQFFTNSFAVPDKGARKKIHSGSGAVGDGYGPGSPSSLPCLLPSDTDRPDIHRIAAAFFPFHAPVAAWLYPPEARGPTGDDTLLAPGEVYDNFVRLDVWYKGSDSN